ncbi:alpha/beta hydrolase [Streptomyces sp. Ru71]|uniref:bis(hydroxyethyl) terephthalate hydrolase n=1 Tax=Streptomyces sp. Ru71 TaxID=2080746 RepID=UPI000CDD56F0|nr:dienelactone hydrolase family protein [Streptomyces sp. Ru71]POX54523.1 alpha/beta hydrolase [Streptomyces sp. Ru71]
MTTLGGTTAHRPPTAPTTTRRGGRLAGVAAALTAAVALTTLGGTTAHGADNPYERGPAPTEASVEAPRGPYAVSETTVSPLAVTGFGGGTVYYPTSTADGTFGAIAVSPGYTGTQSSIAWLGPRLASQGFVVFTIDTLTTLDQPDSRGRQLLAALDYLTQKSSVRGRIDSTRLGVMGHSMGGGGSLEAAKSRPSLQAAIPLTPWNLDKTWPEVATPTLIFGADGDTIAPVATHAEPFYTSLPASLDRAYLELNGATHFTPNTSNTTIAKYSIAWLKRFIDDDTRYEQFLCPLPRPGLTIEEYRGNCPHTS